MYIQTYSYIRICIYVYIDGDLIVKCSYKFNTKGDLDVSLIEHLLKPKNESPKDVEVCISIYI
jgi:hypothetical protein